MSQQRGAGRRELPSKVSDLAIRYTLEDVPCRVCRATVSDVTVALWDRQVEDPDAPGGFMVETKRRVIPPLCDGCRKAMDARDRIVDPRSMLPSSEFVVEDWLEKLGVTRDLRHATLENFDTTHATAAHTAAQEFTQTVIESVRHQIIRSVFFFAPVVPEQDWTGNGNGKSHLAVGVARAIRMSRPDISVVYDSADRLVSKVQDSYGTGKTDALIDSRAGAGLYILDDIGRERPTENTLAVLCTVLEERKGSPTLLTSNNTLAQFAARYAHLDETMWNRVESRLGDGLYRHVAVLGPDRRFRDHQ